MNDGRCVMPNYEEELKIDHSGICKCCKGARKTLGGYIWTFEYRGEKIADL